MSDIIGLAIFIALVIGLLRDGGSRKKSLPKSPDDEFLRLAKIKPWKGEK